MKRNYKRLKYADRTLIEEMLKNGAKPKDISTVIGVHIATIYKELQRGNQNGKYLAEVAQRTIS